MSVDLQHATVQVGSAPLAYWRRPGPKRAASVLLVHGLGASSHIWLPLVERAPAGLDLIALDLPGAGASANRGALGPQDLAALALDFLGAVKLSKVDVVAGHSLGGAVALEMGLAAPERVGSLMIVNAAPALPALTRLGLRAPGVQQLMALPEHAPRRAPKRLFTQLYLWGIFGERRGVTADIVDGYARLAESPDFYRNMAETLQGFARHGRRMSDLAQLALPTSIVWGERDPLFRIGVAERLARAIPQAALHRLPRCGHCPPQESPEVVAQLLMELVSRVHRVPARAPGGPQRRIS